MVLGVVGEVASLTPASKVFRFAVFGLVIKVGDGEHNAAPGLWMGLSVFGSAVGIGWASFASVIGQITG